jgi:ABC-2 type transport system ATP-binding protein
VTLLNQIAEVENAWLEADGQYGITCAAGDKMDVLLRLNELGIDVLDFTTEEQSLEDLFVEYTRKSE